MDDLGSALQVLARQAEAPAPADPAELWAAGHARVRRRRVRAAAITAVAVVLVGYGVLATPEPTVVMPAGEPHAPAIPKNVYEPNRFLAGVSDEGPPGQLAVIAQKQGDSDSSGQWFGISATTGEYRVLDLPGLATDATLRLSPDGTRIAYWVTGPTRRTEFSPSPADDVGGPLPERPVGGVAVYDTRDGSVLKHLVASDYGLETESTDDSMHWLSTDSVALQYGLRVDRMGSVGVGPFLWNPGDGAPRAMPGTEPGDHYSFTPGGPEGVLRGVDPRFTIVDSTGRATGHSIRVPTDHVGPFSVSIWGDRVVKAGQRMGGFEMRLAAGSSAGKGAVSLRQVGTIVNPTLLGWQSPDSVLVTAYKEGENRGDFRGLYRADLARNSVSRIGGVSVDLDPVQVAEDLLGSPLVDGRKPPSYVDVALQSAWFLGAVLLLLGLVASAGWMLVRRRRA